MKSRSAVKKSMDEGKECMEHLDESAPIVHNMDIQIGDVVTLKKQHPCGSKEWEVLRVGMDFRLKCLGCDHQVMIPRKQLEKNVRQIVSKGTDEKKAE